MKLLTTFKKIIALIVAGVPDNAQSLSYNYVWPIYEDMAGDFWVGPAGGLDKFDRETEQFTHYRHNPDDPLTISNDLISAIYEDKAGILWVGTLGGLNKFSRDPETFTRYGAKEGLPNEVVPGILEDRQGNLWLGTFKGLSKFNLQTETFKNYTPSDGLQSDQFSVGHYQTRDGQMFFGGVNGFNAFYPEEITDNAYPLQKVGAHPCGRPGAGARPAPTLTYGEDTIMLMFRPSF